MNIVMPKVLPNQHPWKIKCYLAQKQALDSPGKKAPKEFINHLFRVSACGGLRFCPSRMQMGLSRSFFLSLFFEAHNNLPYHSVPFTANVHAFFLIVLFIAVLTQINAK